MKTVILGQQVRDTVSGFAGIAVCAHEYLQGCRRITVQPPVGPDGKLPETAAFDEHQLEVTGQGVAPLTINAKFVSGPVVKPDAEKEPGGPMLYAPPPRPEGRRSI